MRVKPDATPSIRPCAGGIEIGVEGGLFQVGSAEVRVLRGGADTVTLRLKRALEAAAGLGNLAQAPSGPAEPFEVIVAEKVLRPVLEKRLGADRRSRVRWSLPERLTAPEFQARIADLMRSGRVTRCMAVCSPQGADLGAVQEFHDAVLGQVPEAVKRLHVFRMTSLGAIELLDLPKTDFRSASDIEPGDRFEVPSPEEDPEEDTGPQGS